jgi:tRNA pseudouridine38-40 synthase
VNGPRSDPSLPHGVRLLLSYDGTDFHGWQRQPNARTVQGELESALRRMEIRCSPTRGASRTDAGVHAFGNVVGFDCERAMAPLSWVTALNGLMPNDVAVREAVACEPGYDPRFDALRKRYRYLLRCGRARDPHTRRIAWDIGRRLARRDIDASARAEDAESYLDVDAMREAARAFLGTHDFQAFQAANDERENTVRTMLAVDVISPFEGDESLVAIEVEGNAFLKNMVRILAGTLVEVGRRRLAAADVAALLRPGAVRTESGPTAPAHGLVLVRIDLGRAKQTAG